MAHTNTKKGFVQDTFEQIAELGKSTAKQSVKAVAQSFNPFNTILEGKQSPYQQAMDKQKEVLQQKKSDHTPLDFDKLNSSYQNQDQQALADQRRFFQMVKTGEEKAIEERKKEEQERLRKQAMEDQQAQEDKQQQMQGVDDLGAGKGKAKGVLGKARPKAQVEINPENRANKPKG